MKKIIFITSGLVVLAALFYFLQSKQTDQQVLGFATQAECEQTSGKECRYVTCDNVPAGKNPKEACPNGFKFWEATEKAKTGYSTNVPEGEKNGWNSYRDEVWNFEIKYPNSFKPYSDKESIQTLAFIPPCDPASIVCFFYSKENLANTNFGGAGVGISALENLSASNKCKAAQEGEQSLGTTEINGISFAVFEGSGAATGHSEIYRNYRAQPGRTCMEVTLRVTETNLNNYPQGTVKKYNEKEVWSKLEQVLSTVSFFSGAGVSAGSKQKVCPEQWIEDRMPTISDPDNSGSKVPREYFILKGQRRELSEFDMAWVKANCSVKAPEAVY